MASLSSFFYISLVSVFSFAGIRAQAYVDLLTLSYDYALPTDFEAGGGQGDFREFFADLNLPIPVGDHAIVTGLQYEKFAISLLPGAGRKSFTALTFKVGMNLEISERWTTLVMLLPKYAGASFQDGSYQLGLYNVFGYQKNEFLKYKFGIYANTELFGPFVVPILGLYYQRNRWEANLNLPITFNVNYAVAPNLKLGDDFIGIKKSYEFDGSQETAIGNDQNLYLEKANNEVGLFVQLKTGPVRTQLIVGSSVLRSFEVYEVGQRPDFSLSAFAFGDERMQLDENFPNGLFFKVRSLYRFDTE